VGPLPVGASTTLVVHFTAFASSTSLDRTNVVATAPTTPPDEPGVPPSTNRAPYDISNVGYSSAKVRIAPDGRAAQVGEEVVFRITVTNTGDVPLVSVPLQDTYETAYLAFTGAAPATVDLNDDGVLDWSNVGPLLVGESVAVTARFTAVASSLGLDRTNTVVVSPSAGGGEPPVPPQTNRAPYDISQAGYTLEKVRIEPAGAARIGDAVSFAITVVNTGDVDFVTLPVTDRYETVYLAFTNAAPEADDVVDDGELVWTDVGPLAAGASTTLVVHFRAVGSSAGQDRTNVVATWPTTPPDEPGVPALTSAAPYQVSIAGYLLTKTRLSPTNRPAVVLEEVLFELTVLNTGDVALVSAPVVDRYETNYLHYVDAVPAADDTLDDGELNWADIGPLSPGASTSIVATFQAIATTLALDRTNIVTTAPTTGVGQPPVYPQTNEAPYAVRYGWLGDTVWIDLDSNGLPNENLNTQGLNNIRIFLYRVEGGVTNLVDQTLTYTGDGHRGYYVFTNLTLGSYLVEVDLTTVPSNLDIITTQRRIPAQLTPNGFYLLADFGFNSSLPTEVDLLYFRGSSSNEVVQLTWATGVERENMGYHLYRATREDGTPERITGDLIPGMGTGVGSVYAWTDTAVEQGGIYYYWLEDVENDGDVTRHGPVRVSVGETPDQAGVPFLAATGGVHTIRVATLASAGLPVYSMNADTLAVRVNGQPSAIMVTAENRPLRDSDLILLYVPNAGDEVKVGTGTSALRMEAVYAGPVWDDGETWMGISEDGNQLAFAVGPTFVRYLLADFADSTAWVLDVTDVTKPRLLVGVENMMTAHGVGLYLSYGGTNEARCIAVTPAALQELRPDALIR
jgi:hypothetical protein